MAEKPRPPIKMPDVLPKDPQALKAELGDLTGGLPTKPDRRNPIKVTRPDKKPRN
jgi:hypothetical protein